MPLDHRHDLSPSYKIVQTAMGNSDSWVFVYICGYASAMKGRAVSYNFS